MRNVRVAYSKQGRMKYVSHLDMNRYVARLVKVSGVPAWHTEGFNQHLYVTFALPLSLGITADVDYFDMKIVDDDFTDDMILNALNKNATEGMTILSVSEPLQKVPELSFAQYTLTYKDADKELLTQLQLLFSKKYIPAIKRGKKGKTTEVNLAEKIKSVETFLDDGVLSVVVVLPAGNIENINPALFLQSFCDLGFNKPEICQINRNKLFNSNMEVFC